MSNLIYQEEHLLEGFFGGGGKLIICNIFSFINDLLSTQILFFSFLR